MPLAKHVSADFQTPTFPRIGGGLKGEAKHPRLKLYSVELARRARAAHPPPGGGVNTGARVAHPPPGGGVNKGDRVAEPAGPPGGGVNKGDRVAEPPGPPVKGEIEIKLKYINL